MRCRHSDMGVGDFVGGGVDANVCDEGDKWMRGEVGFQNGFESVACVVGADGYVQGRWGGRGHDDGTRGSEGGGM